MNREYKIEPFVLLGDRLQGLIGSDLIAKACLENEWFTSDDIEYAINVLRTTLLDRSELTALLSRHKITNPSRDVCLVMAGNIPFAGLYDMVCVLSCGHRCFVKLSSKDKVLMQFVIDTLMEIDSSLPIYTLGQLDSCDALIFSGSDAAAEIYRSRYNVAETIARTSRFSVAVLDGNETQEDLEGLSDDLFRYFGLGCRNVSMVFVPQEYDISKLSALGTKQIKEHTGFINNSRAVRALRFMEGVQVVDCDGFIMSEGCAPSNYIAELKYVRYDDISSVEKFLSDNENKIQCVVSNMDIHACGCSFGRAQRPEVTDFADGIDVVEFLSRI
ncbi:MAG: hypothetical protein R3Y15_06585 [Rikenellaceae bacterium]